MKTILYQTCFLLSLVCIKASGQDAGLRESLNADRIIISDVVNKYELSVFMQNCPYLGYWSGRNWIVVCKKPSCFIVWHGNFDGEQIKEETIPSNEEHLICLFSLTQQSFSDYTISQDYHFWYSYFVLYNSTHESYIECNSFMKKKSDTKESLLPQSIIYLWEIMMPRVFCKR